MQTSPFQTAPADRNEVRDYMAHFHSHAASRDAAVGDT